MKNCWPSPLGGGQPSVIQPHPQVIAWVIWFMSTIHILRWGKNHKNRGHINTSMDYFVPSEVKGISNASWKSGSDYKEIRIRPATKGWLKGIFKPPVNYMCCDEI